MVLTIFFVAWLFSLAFLELMVNIFTKNLHEKTKWRENSVIAQVVHSMEGAGVLLSDAAWIVFQTKIVYQAKLLAGCIPSWTYSKADIYQGSTIW